VRKSIFLNLSLFQFLSFVRRGIFYTFMTNYLYDLMHTVTNTALLGTLDMVASALGQNLLWGRVSESHKLRGKLIITGESIAAAGYFIVFLVHKHLLDSQAYFMAGVSLIVGLSALEFFWSMSDVGWATLLADVTTSQTRGKIVGTLGFIASLGRMIGINFAGFLYQGGNGFKQGTLFYIVTTMLLASSALMWVTAKSAEKKNARTKSGDDSDAAKQVPTKYDKRAYTWFMLVLILIVIGAACTNQVYLLFIKLPEGLNATDVEESLILTAWTIGGMAASLLSGWLADRIGRTTVLLIGFALALLTPLTYASAYNVGTMALFHGVNGASFWTIQTAGFSFAADAIPEDRRGRLFSVYNTVMALAWGPAGFFVGGPLADVQVKTLGLTPYSAFVNTFYASSAIVAVGTLLFILKVAKPKPKTAQILKTTST